MKQEQNKNNAQKTKLTLADSLCCIWAPNTTTAAITTPVNTATTLFAARNTSIDVVFVSQKEADDHALTLVD